MFSYAHRHRAASVIVTIILAHTVPFPTFVYVCSLYVCLSKNVCAHCACIVFIYRLWHFSEENRCDEVHILTHAFSHREKKKKRHSIHRNSNNKEQQFVKRNERRRWCRCDLFNKYALMRAAFHYLFFSSMHAP